MFISLLPSCLLLSLVAAQSTTSAVLSVTSAAAGSTASVCAAQPVLEACLASTEAIANACSTTDYQCLCEKWDDVLTCFADCPNDARYSSVTSNHDTYCNDASVYLSTTTTPISAASSASSAATTAPGSQTTGSDGAVQVASTTSSKSSSATGKSGAGSNMVIGAGQVVLGLAGVVGALL